MQTTLIVGLSCALALSIGAPASADAKPKNERKAKRDTYGLPLPGGSRTLEPDLYSSSRGFRKTVRFYKHFLNRKALKHEEIPVYRYRGVAIQRFISQDSGSRWSAIHVFRFRGVTRIYLVPTRPLTQDKSQGRDTGPAP